MVRRYLAIITLVAVVCAEPYPAHAQTVVEEVQKDATEALDAVTSRRTALIEAAVAKVKALNDRLIDQHWNDLKRELKTLKNELDDLDQKLIDGDPTRTAERNAKQTAEHLITEAKAQSTP